MTIQILDKSKFSCYNEFMVLSKNVQEKLLKKSSLYILMLSLAWTFEITLSWYVQCSYLLKLQMLR